ncbi:unnamed protein product [Cuscuta epithymum]|uniref:non-specific serine/threonine protein kinase n=1 Tax=Cuscuta epithymum TaxID=186058 RepID=A0AAV0D4W0_9ASTE|nr:unnamed protein product [Cuscuta epithymum]
MSLRMIAAAANNNLLCFLISVFCFLSSASPAAVNEIFIRETQQLLSFKAGLSDQTPFRNWVSSGNPCGFTGITCKRSKLAAVDLSGTHLGADFSLVSAFLLTLPDLESLVLKNTGLSGSFKPPGSSQCGASLSYVDLAGNSISGTVYDISGFIVGCPGVKSLNLSRNYFEQMNNITPGGGGGGSAIIGLQSLDLSYNNISGPDVFSWLSSGLELRWLSLKGNRISGKIPELNLKNLSHLDLSSNDFSTEFPSFRGCWNLEHLDLSSNRFSGDVGASLSSCRKLSFLNLTNTSSSPAAAGAAGGGFPVFPSGSLKYLYLRGNEFQGELPREIGDLCTTLLELDLGFNNLSGMLPESLGACSALELLDISYNNFSGELPVKTLLNMTAVKTLAFSFNNFYGQLPEALSSRLMKLETLDLSSNNITGLIPPGICTNPGKSSLKVLYLQNNLLWGEIPDSLSNCTELVTLDLSFNYINGRIPPSLGSLSKLKDLIVWLNQLEGEIPQEVMYLQSLENLILDFNNLTGPVPAGLSNCTKLNWISLSNNQLSGEIPAELGRLPSLAILKLGNNSISGSIPPELGDCPNLIWLDLNTNFLNGSIPPTLFKQSGNIAVSLFTGKRYVYIKNDGSKQCHGAGNLLEFGGIRLDRFDRISTRHPCNFTRVYRGITKPTFNHNGSMIFLDLSHNQLGGGIPEELGSMYYLQILNLGHNALSGPIPQKLGGLKNVAILDLSHNRLQGSIPSPLTSLTLLGEIDLSNNNLSGKIPESAPFDTFPDYRFANNSGLCGYPLPPCGSAGSNSSLKQKQQKSRQVSLVGNVAIGLLLSLFCIIGLTIVAVEGNRKRRQREEAAAANSEPEKGGSWKPTGIREALSINLSTFDHKPLLRKLTFADLLEATNGFHNDSIVGAGGFGDVYKAHLKDGSVVAIKKLIHISGQGDREFMAEMETIGKVKHPNLVPLLGYCKVGEERLLVYEYMKYGSLDDVLHKKKKLGIKLNWAARRKIAIGAARGLDFLHNSCIPHIIHRDMKSSNVLLDENLEARVSDFGMARLMSAMDTHLSVSTLAGTPGYVPPEYYHSFRCSAKGDVYSYGVVLLELLTGRQPTDSTEFGDNNLVGWVKQHAKMKKIREVFDPELLKEDPSLEVELLQHLRIACSCLDDRAWKRPTMVEVMAMFKEIQMWSGSDSSPPSVTVFGGVAEGIQMSIQEGNEQHINQQ